MTEYISPYLNRPLRELSCMEPRTQREYEREKALNDIERDYLDAIRAKLRELHAICDSAMINRQVRGNAEDMFASVQNKIEEAQRLLVED